MKDTELKKLYARSGNSCAFPDCRQPLVPEAAGYDQVVLGEAAHIVGEAPGGPRGASALTLEQRNLAANRILLCARHHQLVDAMSAQYTVERLHAMKADHERWVAQRLAIEPLPTVVEFRSDTVYSTMLEVQHIPRFIYMGPTQLEFAEIIQKLKPAPGELTPFIQKGDNVITFHDLSQSGNPFSQAVDPSLASKARVEDWLRDQDKAKWVVELLNRALSRMCAARGLRLDSEHHRYYFPQSEPGKARRVRYRGLNTRTASRAVVWQPTKKSTGEVRNYWLHRAVSLQFLTVGTGTWVLAIRPELRITKDGETPLDSEKIGARVTRRKSRMFNYDLLNEVNFWRDYLGGSKPQLVLGFGSQGQFVRIPTKFLTCEVVWPGLPKEHDMPFKNVEYLDDLFTWGEAQALDVEDLDDDDLGATDVELAESDGAEPDGTS